MTTSNEHNNAPAVPVYQLAKLGGPTETAWIDVTQEVYEDAGFYKDDFKRRILSATPATKPAQYKDSTPQLSVGESSFESWFESYNPANKGDKQRAREAYAAGMGDPLVTVTPAQEVGLTDGDLLNWIERQDLEELSMGLVVDADHDGEYFVNGDDCVTYYGPTLREAIDNAIRARKDNT